MADITPTKALVIEFEGYQQVDNKWYPKELCIVDLTTGKLQTHCLLIMPLPPGPEKTQAYIYDTLHGIPYYTPQDQPLPHIPPHTVILTHGIDKARTLQRLYPDCHVTSLLENTKYSNYPTYIHTKCPLTNHGPNCAHTKANFLRQLLKGFI